MSDDAFKANKGDVIQLRPDNPYGYGPLLCIVYSGRAWGVECEALVPGRNEMRTVPLRLKNEDFERIGPAVWVTR